MPTIAALPYPFAFPPGGLALLIIDMQRDFIEPGGFGAALGTFVDAAHMVYGTFLCCLWSSVRLYVRATDAASKELIAVTNTAVVNTQTICELLREIAAEGLACPATLVPDDARYRHNAAVEALAATLKVELLFLPGTART